MAGVHPWNVHSVQWYADDNHREYEIEFNAPNDVDAKFVWNTVKEVPAMVKAIRTWFNPNSTMVDLDDADQALREILERIDGVVT